VNETMIPDSLIFNLESTAPLKIGFGQNDIFKGQIKEVRLYNRVLKEEEIESLTISLQTVANSLKTPIGFLVEKFQTSPLTTHRKIVV